MLSPLLGQQHVSLAEPLRDGYAKQAQQHICLLFAAAGSFHHPVDLRVAGCGAHVLHLKPGVQASPHGRGELCATVNGPDGWHTKSHL